MLVPPESSSAVLVMMRSKSVSILLDWTTVAKTARLEGVPKFDAFVRRTA